MALGGNDSRSENSHLGKTIHFNGTITGSEDVSIDGEVEGTIELSAHAVIVGPHGKVSASVQARELIVHGKLKGNAQARDRIEVSRTGSVLGDMAMARISIEDGAFIQGRVDIRAANVPAAAAAHASRGAAADVPAASTPTPSSSSPSVPSPAAPSSSSAAPQQGSFLDHK